MFWIDSFKNRIFFNVFKVYVKQLDWGYEYKGLKLVYVFSLVNEDFEFNIGQYYYYYVIVYIEYLEKCIDGLQFVFVELFKFKV